MTRDMDLVRKILLWCEENLPADGTPYASEILIEGYTVTQIVYNTTLLIEKGYILGTEFGADNEVDYALKRLTFDGHQFLESIKNDKLWEIFKGLGKEVGLPLAQASIPILIKYAAQQLGITV